MKWYRDFAVLIAIGDCDWSQSGCPEGARGVSREVIIITNRRKRDQDFAGR
jgi:hypothetical protein